MSTTAPGTTLEAAFLDDFTRRWQEAWNAHDGHAVAAMCTDDVEVVDPAAGELRGREAVARWVEETARAFPDYRFDQPDGPYVARDQLKAIIVWRMVGTNTGPIDPPGFAATGKPFTLDGVDQWTFRDGLLKRLALFYDVNGMMVQLGLAPPPGSRTEQAMVMLQKAAVKAASAASAAMEKSRRGDSNP